LVVKIKTGAEKAIAKLKAMSETEVVSAKAEVEAKAKEPILEQKVEPEVETKAVPVWRAVFTCGRSTRQSSGFSNRNQYLQSITGAKKQSKHLGIR